MRIVVALIMLALSAGLSFCALKAGRAKKAIAPALHRLLLALLPPVLGNMLIILSYRRLPALVGMYTYIIGMDYVMAGLLRFTLQYCGMNWQHRWQKRLFYALLGLDVLQILLNPVFGHAFYTERILAYGAPYFRSSPLWGLGVHRVLCYGIFIAVLLIFLVKTLRASRIESERYSIILLAMVLTGLWETFYIFSRAPIDRSMIGYGVFGLLVFYLSLYYRPLRVLDRMLANLASGLPEALLFFLTDGSCVWANTQALRFLQTDERGIEHCGGRLRAMFPGAKSEGEWSRDYVLCDRYYTLTRQIVRDAQGRPVGSLLSVRDNTEQKKQLEREHYNATHDSLTDFYTREFLYQRIRETLDRNPGKTYTVSYLDIHDFKLVNDIFGRDFGDHALVTLADSLLAMLPPGTIYGRLSGDCFGLFMAEEDFDAEKAERYLHGFTVQREGVEHTLLIHQGVYVITEPEIDVSLMFDRAHMALATIKNEYKKHLAVYDEVMREKTLWDQHISDQVQLAVEKRQIVPYLQAIVDAEGRVVGAEALARWIHPTYGFLPPVRFLPTLEENGMIADVDRHMWRCACEILARWQAQGDTENFLSVNVSPKDFYFMDVPAELGAIVREYGVPAARLRVEITESMMMTESLNRIAILRELKDAGFFVEMDDFGSGYSSLNMLKDMPVDVVKIDMAFLTETDEPQRSEKILRNVMTMVEDLSIVSLTEGVETAEQFQMLREMGCRLFQGYHFAKPLPLAEFEAAFRS